MVMYLVRKQNGNELRDTGKEQVGMKSFGISCFSVFQTETVLHMIDGTLDRSTSLIGILPFIRATDRAGIKPQVFLGINIDHPAGF